ncbi:metallophosphoesterase [Enterococcus devriesei]|uniref:metallophosphoesterase n=1 Tax=Enterococcus devriesei TaxID=319970 RepID=UPI0028A7023D|nr:metallophosphoesterase [Enterococcus devriesei]
MLVLFLMILALLYCRYQTYRLVEKHFKVTKNSAALSIEAGKKKGLTIAQISDSHFSPFYSPKRFDKIVAKLNQAEPDIVLFTGDLIENYNYWQTHDTQEISQQLATIRAPKGKFAILGNHDYRSNGGNAVSQLLEAGGFTLLTNQSTLVDQLSLTGIDDSQEGTPDYSVTPVKAYFSILMVHEPDQVKQLPELSHFDLILAGHSHGGQIRFPLFTYKNFGSKTYDQGVYKLTATTSLVVNTGLGTTGPPLRFRVIPEILYFHI